MDSLFSLLPQDIKRYEILPKIDDISLFVLRHSLLGSPFPSTLTESEQKNIVSHGLSLAIYFWEKLDKDRICQYAAEDGSLDILEYAHDNAYPWDKDKICGYAAKADTLGCLKYSHDNGCSLNKFACVYAAKGGSLACLKYIHKNTLLKEGGSTCP